LRIHADVGKNFVHKCALMIDDGTSRTDWTVIAQLSSSQSDVTRLMSETRSSAGLHLHSAQELSLLGHSLADELSYLSRDLVSSMSEEQSGPTLLEDIDTLHRSLKELESVKNYVQVIEHALKLRFVSWYIRRGSVCKLFYSESAVQHIRDSPSFITESSVIKYQALQDFVSSVSEGCSQVEDGAGQHTSQLLSFIERVRDKTWTDMKTVLFA
jgi:hypothetical protein